MHDYRALVGQLNWLSTQTRPDVSFDVCELSTVLNAATVDDVLRVNKVVKKVKQRRVTLQFQPLDCADGFTIECYSDASFGNLPKGGSQGGFVIFLVDSWCQMPFGLAVEKGEKSCQVYFGCRSIGFVRCS